MQAVRRLKKLILLRMSWQIRWMKNWKVGKNIVHRYPDRVLFLVTICALCIAGIVPDEER
jgi:hypothetical protein